MALKALEPIKNYVLYIQNLYIHNQRDLKFYLLKFQIVDLFDKKFRKLIFTFSNLISFFLEKK